MRILSDQEILDLIAEPKRYSGRLNPEPKDKSHVQHKEREIEIKGSNNTFRIIVRQNKLNALDFSLILTLQEEDSNVEYRLIRFNGKHPSPHTNKWEKKAGQPNHRFGPAFHIHKATQRYQESGYEIDGYAEPTDSYSNFQSALEKFLSECNIKQEDSSQMGLSL